MSGDGGAGVDERGWMSGGLFERIRERRGGGGYICFASVIYLDKIIARTQSRMLSAGYDRDKRKTMMLPKLPPTRDPGKTSSKTSSKTNSLIL